ncbi:hypothetical protein GBA52_009812 [Prunus armeniaca]|nr:hypothetical protein GBA52_009812 [Prunus armeniaca]
MRVATLYSGNSITRGMLCGEKLAYFRINELKDVLTQLGLSKQRKKQVRRQKYCFCAAMAEGKILTIVAYISQR